MTGPLFQNTSVLASDQGVDIGDVNRTTHGMSLVLEHVEVINHGHGVQKFSPGVDGIEFIAVEKPIPVAVQPRFVRAGIGLLCAEECGAERSLGVGWGLANGGQLNQFSVSDEDLKGEVDVCGWCRPRILDGQYRPNWMIRLKGLRNTKVVGREVGSLTNVYLLYGYSEAVSCRFSSALRSIGRFSVGTVHKDGYERIGDESPKREPRPKKLFIVMGGALLMFGFVLSSKILRKVYFDPATDGNIAVFGVSLSAALMIVGGLAVLCGFGVAP
jgi:hypothetical protein